MSIYLPNFNDQRIIDFCGAFGATTDGFYNKLGDLGFTGSIDDRWKAYLIDKYGYFNGLHVSGYENEADFTFNTYTHTAVNFDGTTPDFLYKSAAPLTGFGALSAVQNCTIVAKFTTTTVTPAANHPLFQIRDGTGAIIVLALNTAGQISCNYTDTGTGDGFTSKIIVAAGVVTVGPEFLIHVAITPGTIKTWVNGSAQANQTWTAAPLDHSLQATAYLGASSTGAANTGWSGTISLLYLCNGTADETATHFYSGGDVDLGTDGTLSGAPSPQIFFGGRQVVADWNAGTNQGTGGNFVMNGSV